jgi:hypothetical protein
MQERHGWYWTQNDHDRLVFHDRSQRVPQHPADQSLSFCRRLVEFEVPMCARLSPSGATEGRTS